jgi:hypothetical protein
MDLLQLKSGMNFEDWLLTLPTATVANPENWIKPTNPKS